MKKGMSYITKTDNDNKHPLIKKLIQLGYSDIVLIYASHFSTDNGWTIIQCTPPKKEPYPVNSFLGYTIKSALNKLNDIPLHTLAVSE